MVVLNWLSIIDIIFAILRMAEKKNGNNSERHVYSVQSRFTHYFSERLESPGRDDAAFMVSPIFHSGCKVKNDLGREGSDKRNEIKESVVKRIGGYEMSFE
jgi:hypothetical protein